MSVNFSAHLWDYSNKIHDDAITAHVSDVIVDVVAAHSSVCFGHKQREITGPVIQTSPPRRPPAAVED